METNFLPGRTFQHLEDLNRQALEWSTVRLEHRPQGKAGLIPAKAFEHEQHLPDPTAGPSAGSLSASTSRGTDEYGFMPPLTAIFIGCRGPDARRHG